MQIKAAGGDARQAGGAEPNRKAPEMTHLLRWLAALPLIAAALAAVSCTPQHREEVSGLALYREFCLACHGEGGKGDGIAAAGLPRPPADLTAISARNGGTFPLARVMSTIDGYARLSDHSSIMPEMGPVLQQGGMVPVDTGDGIETPVPVRLLALAEYVKTLQE
jgi:mono/diheme cytochrome c family protein